MTNKSNNKMQVRLLMLLSRSGRQGVSFDISGTSVVLKLSPRHQCIPNVTFMQAQSAGLIRVSDGQLAITKSGKSCLKRHLSDHDPFADQHRILQTGTAKVQHQVQKVTLNLAESPLSRLYSRRQRNGSRYISLIQFEAGDRLRCDFDKSQMQASISGKWHEGSSTGNTARAGSTSSDITDFALDARARLENALEAIGPELAGVALDICCFLKGFECVERERSWPGRSAKLMLKTALAALSRHYGYKPATRASVTNTGITQWGTKDYKPNVTRKTPQYP